MATASQRAENLEAVKLGLVAGGLVPLVMVVLRFNAGGYTDPVAEVLNQCGFIALILLIGSLACTPLKIVSGSAWPLAVRKTLGLLAFFYVLLHFLIYLIADHFFNFAVILEDILKRPFITFGFTAFVLLIPLALTSTSSAVRRMGAKNWQRLHRLAYVAGLLGALHFIWRVKSDFTEPAVYSALIVVLLLIRLVPVLKKRAGVRAA